MLGVSLPTVVNWSKAGSLKAHRTVGGHRRIAAADLVAFARENNYPLPPELLPPSEGRARVLVVDDEPDFSSMVRDYLTLRGGFEVEVADSGFQAGLSVAKFRPDLILMDIMMPDMDGFEVHRTLRESADTRHIPVIACTAFRDPHIDQRIRDERFDALVEKPCKLESLLDMIRSKLRRAA